MEGLSNTMQEMRSLASCMSFAWRKLDFAKSLIINDIFKISSVETLFQPRLDKHKKASKRLFSMHFIHGISKPYMGEAFFLRTLATAWICLTRPCQPVNM